MKRVGRGGKISIKLLITTLLLAIVWWGVDAHEAIKIIRESDLMIFFVVLGIYYFQVYLSSYRWYLLNRRIGLSINYKTTTEMMWVGLFFNQVLPTGIGGDVVRGFILAKNDVDAKKAISSVVWDRITGMLGLVVVVIIGIIFFGDWEGDRLIYTSAAVCLLAITAVILLLNGRLIPGQFRIIQMLVDVSEDGRQLLSLSNASVVVGLSVLVQLLLVVGVYLVGIGVDVELGAMALLVVVPVSVLMMALPVSFAGWGVREGVMIAGLTIYGISAEQALAISLLFGVELLLIGLIGGLYVWNHGYLSER